MREGEREIKGQEGEGREEEGRGRGKKREGRKREGIVSPRMKILATPLTPHLTNSDFFWLCKQ